MRLVIGSPCLQESVHRAQGPEGTTNLPAGLEWKTCYGHAMNRTARTRSHPGLIVASIPWTIAATCELNDKALTHELGAI